MIKLTADRAKYCEKLFLPFADLGHLMYHQERYAGYDDDMQPKFQILRAHEILIGYRRYETLFKLYAVQNRKRSCFDHFKVVFASGYSPTATYTEEGYAEIKQIILRELAYEKNRIEEIEYAIEPKAATPQEEKK